MWWVGTKHLRIYLAAGLALLQEKGQRSVRLVHAPTLPLLTVLAQLQALALGQGITVENRVLYIDLSTSYAKGCALPSEQRAQTSFVSDGGLEDYVSAQLGVPRNNLYIQSDAGKWGIVAAITGGHFSGMTNWASGSDIRLAGIQPLWSRVTQTRRAQVPDVRSVVLIEPDGMTLLSHRLGHQPVAAPYIFETVSNANLVTVDAQLDLWRDIFHFTEQDMAIFRFHDQDSYGIESGLRGWAGHWGME